VIDPASQSAAVDVSVAVSIIILNYNGRAWLERCLPAAVAETASDCELIVVDNGSSDGSLQFLSTFRPVIRVLPLESNVGFAAGNNAGARLARGRYLAFLNNDAAPQPGWLAAVRAALDSHPHAGLAASCIVYLSDPGIVDSAGDGITRFGGAFKRSHGRPVSEAREAREVFGACGAACLIRRGLFDDIGGFDEAYFAVHEDVDLSYRCQLLGYHCIYSPDAVVHHAGSATMGRVSERSVFWGQRNLEWTYVKNTPWLLLLFTLPGHVLYNVAAAFYFARSGHLRTFLSAKWHAISELPRVLRQRRDIQRRRRTSLLRLWKLMDGGWIALKIREKRFDLGLTPSA
jgi:GT2 family glycosyltransferase